MWIYVFLSSGGKKPKAKDACGVGFTSRLPRALHTARPSDQPEAGRVGY